jgi:lysozyme
MNFRVVLKEHIILNEGIVLHTYLDSLGIQTVGVGFNLNRQDAYTRIAALGIIYDDLRSNRISLTMEQATALLEDDIDLAIESVKALLGNSSNLSDERQVVLVDMAFNLGQTRLSGFIKFISAIDKCDWNAAAREMRNSVWARQVGKRADRNIYIMKYNKFPTESELQIKNNQSRFLRFINKYLS